MKKSQVSVPEIVAYIDQLKTDPTEKERFNRFIQRAAARERKRKDGELSAMFLSAIRAK